MLNVLFAAILGQVSLVREMLTARLCLKVCEHMQWCAQTEWKLVDLFVCGHLWGKLHSQGSWAVYVLT